jgi:ABC-2 type transport system ATP-binding protein
LVLDEPTRGLDPNQIVEIRSLIRELGREKTVVFSTHILSEVEAMCDRVLIINRGEKVFDGTKKELQAGMSGNERVLVEIRAAGDPAAILRALPGVDAVNVVAKDGNGVIHLHVESERGRDVREQVFNAAVQNHWILLEMRRETVSFEDVFRELTAA